MNPLFNVLGGAQPPIATNNSVGNVMRIMQRFQQFKANFTGNPRQQVQELLNSGRMTQAQFNQLQGMAQQLMRFM